MAEQPQASDTEDPAQAAVGTAAALSAAQQLREDGNGAFRQGGSEEALSLYTRGLEAVCAAQRRQCRADELAALDHEKAVLYSNRSCAHLSVGDADLALADAKRAVSADSGFPKAHYRLVQAEEKCGGRRSASLQEALRADPQHEALYRRWLADVRSTPELAAAMKPTRVPPGGRVIPEVPDPWSNLVRLVEHPRSGGWCVVAARDLGAGDVVLAEAPLCSFSLDDGLCSRCQRLLESGVVQCAGGCESYCSDRCRDESWREYHAVQCRSRCRPSESAADRLGELRSLLRRSGVELSRCLPILVAARAVAVEASGDQSHPLLCSLSRGGEGLQRVTDGASAAVLAANPQPIEIRHAQFEKLLEVIGGSTPGDPPFDYQWYRNIWSVCCANAIDICALPDTEVCALLRVGSFFNHSCLPNTTHVSGAGVQDHRVLFKTTREVAEGEELCISYVDPTAGLEDRREALRQLHAFECECGRCVRESAEH